MKKGNKKFSVLQFFRLVLQIVFFIFTPTLYIGALEGVKQLYLAVIHQSISVAILPQLIEVVAIIPITIVLGRFFCGWMCGFGSFSDFIYLISHRVLNKKLKISEQADAFMKSIKYIVLAVLVVAVWSLNITVFSTASPWDAFGMLAVVGKAPDFSYVISNLTIGFIILMIIVFASAFIERFFCRYLCPMGAIFAITSKLRIAKIKKPSAQCGKCRMCTNSCSMGIPLYKMDVVNSGECINCMKCIAACPRRNTEFTIANNDVRPFLAGAATVAAISGMYFTGDFTANTLGSSPLTTTSQAGEAASSSAPLPEYGFVTQTESSPSSSSESPSAPQTQSSPSNNSAAATTVSGAYKDGTYQGTGSGFRGASTVVSVVVSGGKISTINVDSYGDDRRFFNRAYSSISPEIVSSQSASVDSVSGATYSSNGIIQAVSNALSAAQT